MGSVLLFVNENGGVGKSSLIFNTAWEFSKKKKVLVIDLDGQSGNITRFFGVDKTEDMNTMLEIMEDRVPVEDAMVEVKKNLYLIPADSRVVELKQSENINQFKEQITDLKKKFDLIYFDVSPDPDFRHFLSMIVCDYLVIVLEPTAKSLMGVEGIYLSVKEVREYAPDLKFLGLVLNKHNTRRPAKTRDIYAEMEVIGDAIGAKPFKTIITNYDSYDDAVARNKGITSTSPLSRPASEINKLCKEIEERLKKNG